MARESKAGLLMILMLAGIFGFMVYKRMHQPSTALAQDFHSTAENQRETPPVENNPATELAQNDIPRRVVPAAASVPSELPDEAPSRNKVQKAVDKKQKEKIAEFEEDLFARRPATTSAAKPKLPTEIPQDSAGQKEADAGFRTADSRNEKKTARVDEFERETTVQEERNESDPFNSLDEPREEVPRRTARNSLEANQSPASEDREDPFAGASVSVEARPNRLTPPGPVAGESRHADRRNAELEAVESRPRAKPVADEFAQVNRSQNRQPVRVAAAAQFDAPGSSENVPDPIDNAFEAPQVKPRRAAEPVQPRGDEFGERGGDFRRSSELPEQQPVPTPRENTRRATRPAPVTQIDEDFGARPSAKPLIAGDTYQIEPNDNFWTISRKKYGTGRYFMALAQHNLRTIPDPKRMKPGVTISTPSARILEQSYADLIPLPAAGTPGPIQTASTSSVSFADESETTNAGFYDAADGAPMYCVGRGDTLSDIAQRHLGRSSRWIQIYNLNRDVLTDGNTLKIGMKLRLPADASRVEVVGGTRAFR